MSNFRNIIQLGKLTGSLLTANEIDLEVEIAVCIILE
jgi:hypothetical protein